MRPLDRRLLSAGGVARRAASVAIAVGVLSALLAIGQAALLARVIAGAFLGGEGITELRGPLAALAVVLVARALLAWAAEVAAVRISGTVKSDLRNRLLGRAVTLGPRAVAEARTAEVAMLATRGLDALDGWFGRYLPQVALASIVPAAVVVCLATADLVAALTVALTVPLIPVFMVLIGRMSTAHRARRWASLQVLGGRFLDVVAGLPTLRVHGRADAQAASLRTATDAWRTSTLATLRIAFLSALVLELLATLSVALVAVGVGLRLDAGQLSLEVGLFALVLAPEAYLPLRRLGAEFHASEEGLAAARGAFDLIDAPGTDRVPGPDAAPRLEPSGRPIAIEIDDLWVEQPGRGLAAPAAVTLRVSAGEIVAITGPSGAGKSTLLAVVLGMITPDQGRVRVWGDDGQAQDIRELDPGRWRQRIAWVPQMPFLFAGTVADNVRLGRADASPEAVGDALAAAGLGSLDPARPLGERGAGLSSGERRRVGIARAFVREAPVLLLDEPTAGLDDQAEAAILVELRRRARAGAIVLLVAHRPAAAAAADRTVAITWRERPVTPDAGAAPRDAANGPRAVAAHPSSPDVLPVGRGR